MTPQLAQGAGAGAAGAGRASAATRTAAAGGLAEAVVATGGVLAGCAAVLAAGFMPGRVDSTGGGVRKVGAGVTVALAAGMTSAAAGARLNGSRPLSAAMPARENVVTASAAVATSGCRRGVGVSMKSSRRWKHTLINGRRRGGADRGNSFLQTRGNYIDG
jgi:hypothetical protein